MTIRRGGRPRDIRSQAHPMEPEERATLRRDATPSRATPPKVTPPETAVPEVTPFVPKAKAPGSKARKTAAAQQAEVTPKREPAKRPVRSRAAGAQPAIARSTATTRPPAARAAPGSLAAPAVEPVRHPWDAVEPQRLPTLPRELRVGRSNGHHGPLRFLAFALVLGGLVLVLVVGLGLTILRPLAREAVVNWAWDNPGALKVGLVADLVREDLGAALTEPASDDPTEVRFEVREGDTPETLAPRLAEAKVITSEEAFRFLAVERSLGADLNAGTFALTLDMTPEEVVRGLVENRITVETLALTFREGLRLEQMTALLQTKASGVDPQAFYDIVRNPPARLLRDYDWLDLPDGRSLEGYLYPATYRLVVDPGGSDEPVTAAGDLVRMMLDTFEQEVGPERMDVPASRGMSFYEVLSLASIVERESVVPEERPVIAGVYQNRVDRTPAVPHGLLQADPTVLYAWDATQLGEYSDAWQQYVFWDPRQLPDGGYRNLPLPDDLAGYNTYAVRGLPPGPICTPSVDAIDAALAPDTAKGFAFFVAIPEGDGRHDFSKTIREHERKLVQYGYR